MDGEGGDIGGWLCGCGWWWGRTPWAGGGEVCCEPAFRGGEMVYDWVFVSAVDTGKGFFEEVAAGNVGYRPQGSKAGSGY